MQSMLAKQTTFRDLMDKLRARGTELPAPPNAVRKYIWYLRIWLI